MVARALALLLVAAVAAAISPPSAKQTIGLPKLPKPGPVEYLPGAGRLTAKHESGYITVGGRRHLFYWLVESAGNPETDPVVLWLNGGPGCSSFDGFIWEHGPFTYKLSRDGGGVSLHNNSWSWHKAATMIYLDSPAGVGLSLADDADDLVVNDTRTAADGAAFLRRFFATHPRFQANDFYISGESYAGIYVPTLVQEVVRANEAGQQPPINLKGYLVGNGCTDQRYDGNAFPPFWAGKSLVPAALYQQAQRACKGNYWDTEHGSECNRLLAQMQEAVSDLNVYDVLEECYHARHPPSSNAAELRARYKLAMSTHVGWPVRGGIPDNSTVENWAHLMRRLGGASNHNPPCTDAIHGDIWLNDPEVRHAIHAAPVSRQQWMLCTDQIDYTHDRGSMLPIHKEMVQRKGLRALIYSGDHDMAVPHTGSEAWTSELGLPVKEPWRPWYADSGDGQGNQVAGYVTTYESLSYASVLGAGHMVPENKPAQAFYLFKRFITGERL